MQNLILTYWESHSKLLLSIGYNILLSVLVFMICWLVSKIVKRAIIKLNVGKRKIDSTLIPVLNTILTYTIYSIGIIITLDIFGVNTTSIVALLGTIGLAVGFALKDTLSNIAAGIMLLILRPFRVDETIEFGAIVGTVKEINLFTTILETPDGLFVSSPNGVIWSNSIKNFNRNGKRRLDIVVGIAYSDSIDQGLAILVDLIKNETRFLKEPAPRAMVMSMGDSSVNLHIRGWVTVTDYWEVQWKLNQQIKEEIEKAGLTIPFPQREVHLVK